MNWLSWATFSTSPSTSAAIERSAFEYDSLNFSSAIFMSGSLNFRGFPFVFRSSFVFFL